MICDAMDILENSLTERNAKCAVPEGAPLAGIPTLREPTDTARTLSAPICQAHEFEPSGHELPPVEDYCGDLSHICTLVARNLSSRPP